MADPWDWNEADLLRLISDHEQESLTLEFKGAGSLDNANPKTKPEISKDVSALANSAGGTIVYGMREQNHLPVALDPIDPTVTTREWIEQVINSTIHQRIDGIRINPVALTTKHPGKVAYVVHVPQSLRAPHMASDHRYYKRFNFQAVPMEDYEVRDVARRETAPNLWLEFDLALNPNGVPLSYSSPAPGTYTNPVEITVQIVNRAPAMAEYAMVVVDVDTRLRVVSMEPLKESKTVRIEVEHQWIDVRRYQLGWAVPARLPIWQDMRYDVGPISVSIPPEGGMFAIAWRLLTPGMEPHSGLIRLFSDKLMVRMF